LYCCVALGGRKSACDGDLLAKPGRTHARSNSRAHASIELNLAKHGGTAATRRVLLFEAVADRSRVFIIAHITRRSFTLAELAEVFSILITESHEPSRRGNMFS
jgi:hypothetical protein